MVFKATAQFRISCTQMLFKTGALKNFTIFIGKHLCRSVFLIKLQVWRSATLLKKTPNQCFPMDIAKFLRKLFLRNTSGGCFCGFGKLTVQSWASADLLFWNKNITWNGFYKRILDLVRVCYLHIISRNRFNTLLLVNLQKTKTCPK